MFLSWIKINQFGLVLMDIFKQPLWCIPPIYISTSYCPWRFGGLTVSLTTTCRWKFLSFRWPLSHLSFFPPFQPCMCAGGLLSLLQPQSHLFFLFLSAFSPVLNPHCCLLLAACHKPTASVPWSRCFFAALLLTAAAATGTGLPSPLLTATDLSLLGTSLPLLLLFPHTCDLTAVAWLGFCRHVDGHRYCHGSTLLPELPASCHHHFELPGRFFPPFAFVSLSAV